jgi:tetratricopeptide (TPR) repeat protein
MFFPQTLPNTVIGKPLLRNPMSQEQQKEARIRRVGSGARVVLTTLSVAFLSVSTSIVVCLAEAPSGESHKSLRELLKEIEVPRDTPSIQVKTIITEMTYNMGDDETPLIAESRALAQAKRAALEQAGIYVQSYTRVRDTDLTTDEIEAVTAGFMEVEVLEKKRTLVRGGVQVYVRVRCTIRPERADTLLRRLAETSSVQRNALAESQQLLQQDQARLAQEVEKLKDQLARSEAGTKDRLASEVAVRQRRLEARELREKAYQARWNFEMNPEVRVELLSAAIALDPLYGEAWYDRGVEYWAFERYKLAVRDLSEALRLGGTFPSDPRYLRGKAFVKAGQPKEGIEDLTLCLRLCKDLSVAAKINIYESLGGAHFYLKQFDQAIVDYTEIIDRLFPLYCPVPCRRPYSADTYYRDRGFAYFQVNKLPLAIGDFTEAIQRARTDPLSIDQDVETSSLFFRVFAYARVDKKHEAIADLNTMKGQCQSLEHRRRDKSGLLDEICTLPPSKFQDFVTAARTDEGLEKFIADLNRSPRNK